MKFLVGLCLAVLSLYAIEKYDFAYKKEIELYKENGLIKLELRPEVYKKLVHEDLSDMAVFDAEGKVMPSEISMAMRKTGEKAKKALAFVSFDVLKEDKSQQLRFEYDGTKIEMLSHTPTRREDYILDVREFNRGVKTLYIQADEKKYMLPVDVLCSQDLQSWKNIKQKAVIASFDFQNSLLEKNSIDLPPVECAYLRLQTDNDLKILKIEAKAFSEDKEAVLKRQSLMYKKEEDSIVFEVSKNLRLNTLTFELEDKEQFYKLDVYGKNSPEQRWKKIKQAEIYSISYKNTRLHEGEIRLLSRFNYYKLKAQEASYLPKDIPLSYTYKHEDLYFLAQGKAPYILAFGSFDRRVKRVNIRQGVSNTVIEADLSRTSVLGGDEKRLKTKMSSKRYWVWFSLFVGVLLLGFMSWTLFKQMKET